MPLKTIQDEMPSLNMTPMIDIVFLLIIFFMAGTKFSEMERGMDLRLPRVSNVTTLSDAPALKPINIYKDGKVGFEKEIIDINTLAQRLHRARQNYPDLGVVVRGDEDVRHRYVVQVLKACHDAGISELSVSVQLDAQEL